MSRISLERCMSIQWEQTLHSSTGHTWPGSCTYPHHKATYWTLTRSFHCLSVTLWRSIATVCLAFLVNTRQLRDRVALLVNPVSDSSYIIYMAWNGCNRLLKRLLSISHQLVARCNFRCPLISIWRLVAEIKMIICFKIPSYRYRNSSWR